MLNNFLNQLNPQMLLNDFLNQLNPQMRQFAEYHIQQARQSANPELYVKQVFGNDPRFMQGFDLFNQQGIHELNNFIASNLNR